jgi:serine protease
MKYPLALLVSTALGTVPMVAAAQAPTMSPSTVTPTATVADDGRGHEEVVVDFDDAVSDADVRAAATAVGVTLVPNSFMAREDRVMRALVPSGQAAAFAARLRTQRGVVAADPNFVIRASFLPNDPQLADQWHMTRVGAPTAWNFSCGRGVTVAVVDTGVACENHGEFTRVMDLAGTRCVPGYNFVDDGTHANDDQGHGTHVAGTIAQTTHNGFGVAGLAYCATILPVKVLNANGSGTLADVAEGIRYAADHGAQVINLSLGGGGRSRVMEEAVAYARRHGSVVVCAAGNNGRFVESPANAPGAFAVSAVGANDEIAWFSSRGPEVDIAGPGVNVLQHTICDHGRNRCEQFAAWSGTSMAAPHVAGVAALVISMGVTDPDAVERILRASAAAPEHGVRDRELYGAGIVNAANAVQAVQRANAIARGIALIAALALVVTFIRRRKGALASPLAWGPFAVMAGLGLFFLPWIAPRVVPGVDLAMRPVGDWSVLLGMQLHRWLPFANFGVVLALVGMGFGRKNWRAPIGGFALGTAAYLLATLFTGFHAGPVGRVLQVAWLLANAAACLWVARIGLDRKTSETEA